MDPVKEVEQLASFYEAIEDDARIGNTHICLYMALLHESNSSVQQKSIAINRERIMRNARISRKTYNKCMKELQEYGYIDYIPSSNPTINSQAYLKRL